MGLDGCSALLSGVSSTTLPSSGMLFSAADLYELDFFIIPYHNNPTFLICAIFCLSGERTGDGDLEDFWDLLRGAAGRVRWLV